MAEKSVKPKDFVEFREKMIELVNKLNPEDDNTVLIIVGKGNKMAAGLHGSAQEIAAGMAYVMTSRPSIMASMLEALIHADIERGDFNSVMRFMEMLKKLSDLKGKSKNRSTNPLDHDCDNCGEKGKCPIEESMREAQAEMAEQAPTAGSA